MKQTIKLKKNYEFKKILTKGNYYSGNYLEIFIKKTNRNQNRIGIAIGVKIAKAVKRNRIKRVILENYRLLEDMLNTGYEIVFLWKKKKDVKEATFFNIKKDMIEIFKRVGILP